MSDVSLEGHLHRLCGGRYTLASEQVTIRLSGMSAAVQRAFYRCSKCDEVQRTVEQREAAEQTAVAAMRAQHGLMAPREIKALRESLGLTPQQLGELLFGTPRGVVEGWEKGRYLQNRETDALLRSLSDRETLEQRAARAGVQLPDPAVLAAAPSPWSRRGRAAAGRAADASTATSTAGAAEASDAAEPPDPTEAATTDVTDDIGDGVADDVSDDVGDDATRG